MIARLGERVTATLSRFEPAQESAHVSIGGQQLVRLHGRLTKHQHPMFYVAERFELLDGQVVVHRGTTLGWDSLQREAGDHITIRVPSLVETPLLATVACSKLAFDDLRPPEPPQLATEGLVYLRPQQRELSFHAAPGERPFWEVTQQEDPIQHVSVYEKSRRDGFVHALVDLFTGVVLEGWIPVAQVAPPPPPEGGVSHGRLCGRTHRARPPRVRADWKPKPISVATLARDAALLVGFEPDDAPAGVVEKGAIVRLGKREGRFVTFELIAGGVYPPQDQQFWVAANALGDHREVLEGDPYAALVEEARAVFDAPPTPSKAAFAAPCREK